MVGFITEGRTRTNKSSQQHKEKKTREPKTNKPTSTKKKEEHTKEHKQDRAMGIQSGNDMRKGSATKPAGKHHENLGERPHQKTETKGRQQQV